MYSCGPLQRDEQWQDVQLEHTYSTSMPILDVAWKTRQGQWMIGRGGERVSEISVLWHDMIMMMMQPNKKVAEGEITKTEVRKEMEIFITLTK